jgi:putative sporulation protein YtaF
MNFSLIFSLLLITLLCADAFVFGFSYGLDRVKIPPSSMFLISFISGAMLTLSFLFGGRLLTLLPSFLKTYLPFVVLLLLSLYKIYDALPAFHPPQSALTSDALSHKINRKEVQILSLNEAALLAVTLSIDNISVGLSVGTCHLSLFLLLSYSIFIHVVTIWGGWLLGHYFSKRCSHNLSIISALLLLVLAFAQLR